MEEEPPQKPTSSFTYYSVIIDEMDKQIDEQTIIPKVIKIYDDHQIHYDKDNNPHMEYYKKEDHGDITDTTVLNWSTPITTYVKLTHENKTKIDAIKTYINSRASAICFHNGQEDTNCKFHGIHYHIMVQLETRELHITANSQFRTLKAKLSNGTAWPIYTQKIFSPGNFANYLTKPPRHYMGTNNHTIKVELLKTKAMKTIEPVDTNYTHANGKEKKKPQMFTDIENLLKLMTTYNTSEKNQLITNIHNSKSEDDKTNITYLIRSNTWNIVYKRAQEEFVHHSINPDYSNYYTLFMNHICEQPPDSPHMNIPQTANFVQDWCQEQGIPAGQLILEIYNILKMYHPKKNTLYLQGQSNAGKTYLLNMVLPQKDKVGSHISSKDFPFQECATKSVILINELTLASQAESELYKNILGGEPTYINVKNKPASLLYRKPVFLTSNEPIYRFVSNEKIPLLNRMMAHMNLSTSTIIKKYTTKGIPSPKYLAAAFKNIELLQEHLHIPEDETFMDHQEEILSHLSKDLLSLKIDVQAAQAKKEEEKKPQEHTRTKEETEITDSQMQMDDSDFEMIDIPDIPQDTQIQEHSDFEMVETPATPNTSPITPTNEPIGRENLTSTPIKHQKQYGRRRRIPYKPITNNRWLTTKTDTSTDTDDML